MNEMTDTAGIAAIFGMQQRYVTDILTKQPWFPKPVVNLSRRQRRWDTEQVVEAVKARSGS